MLSIASPRPLKVKAGARSIGVALTTQVSFLIKGELDVLTVEKEKEIIARVQPHSI
jgi:hypothetical protein